MTDPISAKNTISTDVPSSSVSAGTKMFPMKLFSSWEVEKSTPNCIPRLCSLTITRLVIKKALEQDLHSVIITIKMQGSKRILRSNEILIQKNGLLDTELDIMFSLQYSHHLKRDGNRLQIMLQRRKKYKNRTMLGFKTLAIGYASMSQVLQHPMDREMNLHACSKDGRSEAVARIVILSLSSQPVDQDERAQTFKDRYQYDLSDEEDLQDDGDVSSNDGMSECETGEETALPRQRTKASSLGNAFANQQRNLKQKFISLIKKFKVSDEVLQSAVQQIGVHGDEEMFDDVESLTDSNPDMDNISLQSVPKPKLKPFFDANQSLIPQEPHKALDYELPSADVSKKQEKPEANSSKKNEKSVTELFSKKISEKASLEFGVSGQSKKQAEKGTNVEGGSKKSTEKPVSDLFSISKKNDKNSGEGASKKAEKLIEGKPLGDGNQAKKGSDKGVEGVSSRKSDKAMSDFKKMEFDSVAFQKLFQDQLTIITSTEQTLPDCIAFMNYREPFCPLLNSKLQEAKIPVINTSSHSDVKATLNSIVNRIQKFMNTSPLMLKLAIVGSEAYVHSIVQPYVKLISSRSPELINHVRFLIVPLGNSFLCQNLAHLDTKYAKMFNDDYWKEMNAEKLEEIDLEEVVWKISTYISEASHLVQLPFAEVVLTYKDKGIDDPSQMVIPFLGEIKIKPVDAGSDIDDGVSSSPPQSSFLEKLKEATSHSHTANTPSTQQVAATSTTTATTITPAADFYATTGSTPSEELELQMDYWLLPRQDQSTPGTSEKVVKKDTKSSLKTAFRSVQIFRPNLYVVGSQQQQIFNSAAPYDLSTPSSSSGLSMVFTTKDKKQKIMRIGKRSRELEGVKNQQIDGISRLICTSKGQNQLLTVNIDGKDWTGIKFFQVSSHWQTHFKHLPVLVFGFSSSDAS